MRTPRAADPVRPLVRTVVTLAALAVVAVLVALTAAAPSASYAATESPARLTSTTPDRDGTVTVRVRAPRAALSPALREVLRLVNVARSTGRSCGGVRHPAARPVRANTRLNRAAGTFARLMGAHSFFSHSSPDGAGPGDRITDEGYRWRAYGENIAAGYTTAASVVSGWLASPGHCQNLMNPAYTQIGLGYAHQDGSSYGHYWVQVFARPM